MLNNNSLSGFNPKAPYQINIPHTIATNIVNSMNPAYNSDPTSYSTNCATMGFQKPYSSEFCRGGG